MSTFRILIPAASILSTTLNICSAQLNEYTQSIGATGESIWQSTSDFIPQQSTSYGTIKLGKELDMTFDFTWGGYTYDPRGERQENFENFFRIGCSAFGDDDSESPCTGGRACNGQGSRYPSLWVFPEQGPFARHLHLSVSSGLPSRCQPSMTITDWGEISIGIKYHINIWFNETLVLFSIGHYSNYSQDPSTWPELIQTFVRSAPTNDRYLGWDMPVWWMSDKTRDPLYNRGNGTFSDITIISSRIPTASPTISP